MRGGDSEREKRQTRAAGHPDRSRDPDDCGGRQAPHRVAAHEDQAAPDETDTGDDLRRNP